MRDRRFEVLPVTPVIFLLTGLLSLLRFRVPIHSHVVLPVAVGFALVSNMVARVRRGGLLYLLLELVTCTAIVAQSGGARSPFLLVFLVPILEAGLRLGRPWGLMVSLASLIALTVTVDASSLDLDRIIATYPFFVMVGLLAERLADALAREVEEHTVMHAAVRLQERELSISREIQQALLPQHQPELPGWDVAWRLLPQQAVAGDLVFFHPAGDTLRAAVADVMGKGVSAAMLVGTVHQLLLRYAREATPRATSLINAALCATTPATMSVSTILLDLNVETGHVRFCNAGHPYPVLWHAGRCRELESSNLVAGWFADMPFEAQEIEMAPGDVLLLYTDGLTDTRVGADRRLEIEGVCRVLARCEGQTSDQIADALLAAVGQGDQVDDVSLIVLRRSGVRTELA